MQSPAAKAAAPLPGTTYVGLKLSWGLDQNLVVELLRNQKMLRQNQVLMQSMVNRMEKRELGRRKGRKACS